MVWAYHKSNMVKSKREIIFVDEEIRLVPYYPYYRKTIGWYQDPWLCKQVDNRDEVYDMDLLKRMYRYQDKHGDLFYIKYKNRLCGDVCLQEDGQINIVIIPSFQNRHIGRLVIKTLIKLARSKNMGSVYADIYDFNTQSKRMFESIGFIIIMDIDGGIAKRYYYPINTWNND